MCFHKKLHINKIFCLLTKNCTFTKSLLLFYIKKFKTHGKNTSGFIKPG